MGRKLIKVNKTTAIVVEPFKNEHGSYITVREFWKPKDDTDGEWRPSKKGLSIPLDEAQSVRKALKWAEENHEDEAKTLESSKKSKKSKDDDDDEDEAPKKKKKSKDKDEKKSKKKSKSRDEDDEEDDDD
jgi:hypothetical protein